jgi:hypothetical protein
VLDPAKHAVRDDLADVELADRVFAPHYAQAMRYKVLAEAAIYTKPKAEGEPVDVLAVGAILDLFDLSAGWGWVRTGKGIGYVAANCIAPA